MVFRYFALGAFALGVVRAEPSPLTPATSRVGQACLVQWEPDTTGVWTDTTVSLMAGSNLVMQKLVDVTTGLDTTSTSVTSYEWTCPQVTPNAPVFFFQFSFPNGSSPTWTTRFTIAAADGTTEPAPNPTQSDGQAIPWGNARLASGGGGGASNSSTTASSATTSSSAVISGTTTSEVTSSTFSPETSPATSSSTGAATTSPATTSTSSSTSASQAAQTTSSQTNNNGGSATARAAVAGGVVALSFFAITLFA